METFKGVTMRNCDQHFICVIFWHLIDWMIHRSIVIRSAGCAVLHFEFFLDSHIVYLVWNLFNHFIPVREEEVVLVLIWCGMFQSPRLFVFVYLRICMWMLGMHLQTDCYLWTKSAHSVSQNAADEKRRRVSVTIRSASLNTIKLPRQLLVFHSLVVIVFPLCSATPTHPHHILTVCFCVCSRRCSTKELETASSNAASVEKPSNTNITWRSIFVFTAVSRHCLINNNLPEWLMTFSEESVDPFQIRAQHKHTQNVSLN